MRVGGVDMKVVGGGSAGRAEAGEVQGNVTGLGVLGRGGIGKDCWVLK